MRLLIDGHLDLAWNAVAFDRDQTRPLADLREREKGMKHQSRGRCTVSLPEMRKSNIPLCFATLLARAKPTLKPIKEFLREDIDSLAQDMAYAIAQGHLAYYRLLESRGELAIVKTKRDLDAQLNRWAVDSENPKTIGVVLHMEGCDPIVDVGQAAHWYEQGLRSASLAHYGSSVYGYGSGEDGPLTDRGRLLLKEFARLGVAVDLTHTADTAFWQTLEIFDGPVFASHCNARKLNPAQRQISDDMIRAIVARGGVVGCVPHNWMLFPGWKTGVTDRALVTLETLANHIDHVCQVAGGTKNVALGTDLDGGFGTEETPIDLDTIYDLHKLDAILKARGYSDADLDCLFHANWLRFLGGLLPSA